MRILRRGLFSAVFVTATTQASADGNHPPNSASARGTPDVARAITFLAGEYDGLSPAPLSILTAEFYRM